MKQPLVLGVTLLVILLAQTPPALGAGFLDRVFRSGSALKGTGIRLKDRLEKDLRARRPAEFAFIAKVVDHVEKGRIPRKDVDQVYLWARRNPTHAFQYFQHGLKIRARRYGVKL